MNRIDLLMVDYSLDGFLRYGSQICKELHKINPGLTIYGCYFQNSVLHPIDGFTSIIKAADYQYDAEQIIQNFRPKAVLTFAHRFFDYMFTLEAHKFGSLVFNFQHAIYLPSSTISEATADTINTVVKTRKEKVITYTKVINHMCGHSIGKTLWFLIRMISSKELYPLIHDWFGASSNADYSFIYGNYWKEYYKKTFLETNTQFVIIGYPELNESTEKARGNLFAKDNKPIVCYLAQPYVEDGIVSSEHMKAFIDKLEETTTFLNLIIKPHPRNDMKLFQNLSKNESVYIWQDRQFPLCDGYIGHDSTIMLRAMFCTRKTMVYRLVSEWKNPLEDLTDYSAGDEDDLQAKIQDMLQDRLPAEVNQALENYVENNIDPGSIAETARLIHSLITPKA